MVVWVGRGCNCFKYVVQQFCGIIKDLINAFMISPEKMLTTYIQTGKLIKILDN